MAEDTVTSCFRGMVSGAHNQFAAAQGCQGDLDGAFRQARCISDRSQTRDHRSPFLPRSLAVKMQINQVSGRLLVVPGQIAHQDIENVVVD